VKFANGVTMRICDEVALTLKIIQMDRKQPGNRPDRKPVVPMAQAERSACLAPSVRNQLAMPVGFAWNNPEVTFE